MSYFGILTPIGEAKQANFLIGGPAIQITHVAVGDGDGIEAEPVAGQTDLVNELRRVSILRAYEDPNNSSRVLVEAGFPPSDGGYWIREVSAIDADGDVIAVANYPSRFKPAPETGASSYIVIRIPITVSSSGAVQELVTDATSIYATRGYVDDELADALAELPAAWPDSEKLGDQLPSYYATQAGLDEANTAIDGVVDAVADLTDSLSSAQADIDAVEDTVSALAALPSVPTGVEFGFWGSSAPAGYVLASGRTIGNASSGATERADADTEALFSLLWSSVANTQLPIQDSAGAASTRGVSAAADFSANKRMPVPDMRGRAGFGLDNMGGSAASRLTSPVAGATIGAAGGSQSHTLITAEMPSHSHTVNDSGHSHLTTVNSGVGGAGTARAGDGVFAATAQTSTTTTGITLANSGSGGAHNNVPPAIVRNVIIKL